MNILNKLERDSEKWIIFEQKIELKNFLKFNSISQYYRQLSNGRNIFLKKTNREFFKTNFSEGFYRFNIFNEKLHFILFLKPFQMSRKIRLIKELTVRLKKIFFSNVGVFNLQEISDTDRLLLSSKNGFNYYQKILSTYKVPNIKETRITEYGESIG
jgi:hypothetical protein